MKTPILNHSHFHYFVTTVLPYSFSYKTGFSSLSRMTTNKSRPIKFCYYMSFTRPKKSQRSRPLLLGGSGFLGLFWKVKNSAL